MKSNFRNSNLKMVHTFRRTRGEHHCVHLQFDFNPKQFDRIREQFFESLASFARSPLSAPWEQKKSSREAVYRGHDQGRAAVRHGRRGVDATTAQHRAPPPLSLAPLLPLNAAASPEGDPHRRFAPRRGRTRPRRPCQCTLSPSKRSQIGRAHV